MTERPITVGDLIAQLSEYDFSAWVTLETGDGVTRVTYEGGNAVIKTDIVDEETPALIEEGLALREIRTEWYGKLSDIVSDIHTLKDAIGDPK